MTQRREAVRPLARWCARYELWVRFLEDEGDDEPARRIGYTLAPVRKRVAALSPQILVDPILEFGTGLCLVREVSEKVMMGCSVYALGPDPQPFARLLH